MKDARVALLTLGSLLLAISTADAQTRTDWSSWTPLGCLTKIEWRSRVTSYNEYARKYEWLVQFRNNSSDGVHFNYVLRPRGDVQKPNHRGSVRPGKTHDMWFLLPVGPGPNVVEVAWDKVRIGPTDDWGGPYWDGCGRSPQPKL